MEYGTFDLLKSKRNFGRKLEGFLAENLGEDWNGIVPDDYFTDENWATIRRADREAGR